MQEINIRQKLIITVLIAFIAFLCILSIPSVSYSTVASEKDILNSESNHLSIDFLEKVTNPVKDCQEQNIKKLSQSSEFENSLFSIKIGLCLTFLISLSMKLEKSISLCFNGFVFEASKESQMMIISFINSIGKEG